MFQINLVPEVQQQKQKAAKRNTVSTIIGIAIIGVCVAAIFIIGAIKVAKNIDLNKTNEKIDTVRAESEQYRELEETVLSLEEGLASIKQILAGENSWTKLLLHLEAATPNDVQYARISIEGNAVDAELKGRNINSLARIVESYKNYQVVVLTGVTNPNEEIVVVSDNGSETTVIANSYGQWNVALSFNPETDHSITASAGDTESKLSYSAATKELTSSDNSISASATSLFNNIETNQYSKEGESVSFNLSFTFDSEAIW